jgi:hypothetical protein
MRQRPVAITIFGILNLGFGLLYLASPLFNLAMTKIKLPGQSALAALYSDPSYIAWLDISMVVGVVGGLALLAFGLGLLFSRNWARLGSIVFALFYSAFVLVASLLTWRFMETVTWQLPGVQPGWVPVIRTLGSAFSLVYGLAYPLLLLFFMTRPNVVAACQPELPPALNS